MCSGVVDGGEGALVAGGEVYWEYVQPAAPTVGLDRCALGDDLWCGILEQMGCYGEVRVPLSASVMDAVGGVRRPVVEWVVVGVDVVVGDEGREMRAVVYVEDSDGFV